jgi:hypothetical protein
LISSRDRTAEKRSSPLENLSNSGVLPLWARPQHKESAKSTEKVTGRHSHEHRNMVASLMDNLSMPSSFHASVVTLRRLRIIDGEPHRSFRLQMINIVLGSNSKEGGERQWFLIRENKISPPTNITTKSLFVSEKAVR